MAILISLRAAATEAGSAEWADWSESADEADIGGVPESKTTNIIFSFLPHFTR